MDVTTTCVVCKKTKVIKVNQAGYEAWQKGTLIQRAMPELSADDREMLISGVCPKCWDDMFKQEDL